VPAFTLLLPLALLAAGSPLPGPAPGDPSLAAFERASAELRRRHDDPAAIAPLVRIHELEPTLAELGKAASAYRSIADDPRAHAEVRSLARWYLAGVEESLGNPERARVERERLGFVTGWWIAGPFDNEGRAGFARAFPPETSIDLAARFPGKAREVGWRALEPELEWSGIVNVATAVHPMHEAVVYALAVPEVAREERARLWIGASGAVRVWLNGVKVLEDAAYHPARLDQAVVEVTLRKGPNRILVKLAQDQGEMAIAVRLTDRRGAPVAGIPARMPPLPQLAPGPAPRPVPVASLVSTLSARAARAKGAAEGRARMDLAAALGEKLPEDLSEHAAAREARRAVELLPGDAGARLLAARLEDQDPNRRRDFLEGALRADPGNPVARLALAEEELRRGRAHEAVRRLGPLVADWPGWAAPRAALAQSWEQVGYPARGQVSLLSLADEFPAQPGAVELSARTARQLDRIEEAMRRYRKLLSLRADDAPARSTLISLHLRRGELDAAFALLDDAVRLSPGDPFLRLRRADLLAANGRSEAAEADYLAAARLSPDEAEVHERRGRQLLRDGRRSEALAVLQLAIDLRPQSTQLKDLTRQLEPARERYESPYLVDAAALAKSPPPRRGDEDLVVLSETKVTRVHPSGLSSTYVQLVAVAHTPRGVEGLRAHPIGYVPGRQDIRVERARVWKPDGSMVDTHQEADRSTSEPWYRLYYDTRVRQVVVPALAPGDVLELSWRVDDVAGENLLSDYFGEVVPFADAARKVRMDYVLLAPATRPIHAGDPVLPGLSRTVKDLPGGVREYRWTAADLPRQLLEPGMPGPAEWSASVHASTYASWDEVARFYEGLVREQLRPGPGIRAESARIVAEVRARPENAGLGEKEIRRAIVKAVYGEVVTGTRYVGLEFGIHGFKPYPVEQVLIRRFGDCKDKASLMHALLEAAGIDSRLVLLRMRRLGNLPPAPASLAVFNHAILYVPELDLWLDGTATGSGSRELPAEDRGATVLVVNPGAPPTFRTIPEAAPGDDRVATDIRGVLSADGSATADGSTTASGAQAPDFRRGYQSESGRRAALERAFARTFPGLRVESVETSDLSRIEDDVTVRFRLAVPRLARVENGGLAFAPFGQGQNWMESWAPLSTRRHDLVLQSPFENRFSVRWELPAGMSPAGLPAPERRAGPFGSWSVSLRAEGNALVAESSLKVTSRRIPAADYPAFREFLSAVDRALLRTVRLVRAEGRKP
jgi:tetratricopeptide (TPR) repeat protein/transglutaminase-like putative cysteine protease